MKGEVDRRADPVLPLDYAPPERPPRWDAAVARFTAGVGLTCLATFAAGVWYGDDMACCSAIGLVIEIAMVGGVFTIGCRVCRWWTGATLIERSRPGTVVGGVLTGALLLGLFFAAEHLVAGSPHAGAAFAFATFFGAIGASPWWVFRPADRG